MRVLMLTNMYPSEGDPSFGTFVHEQVRALRDLGVEIDALFIDGRSTRWNYLLGFPRLWRQLAIVKYDLIHAHYVFSGLIARSQLSLPIVQSYHAPGQMDTYQGWLAKHLAPHVDAVIVTSAEHKELLSFDGAQIVPCGVDYGLFAPRPQAQARAELGWDADRKAVIWVGDPRPEKRVDLAYATYEVIRQRRADTDLHVVSRQPHESIPTYMNAADVLLLTSDHEGSPVVIKEAMACNLPIVSTDVGDVAEVIDGVEGCFLAKQTPEDLAAKVELALDGTRRTLGREAIQHLQTSEEARSIVEIYRQVLERRGGAHPR